MEIPSKTIKDGSGTAVTDHTTGTEEIGKPPSLNSHLELAIPSPMPIVNLLRVRYGPGIATGDRNPLLRRGSSNAPSSNPMLPPRGITSDYNKSTAQSVGVAISPLFWMNPAVSSLSFTKR
jgi:hypothetical protein